MLLESWMVWEWHSAVSYGSHILTDLLSNSLQTTVIILISICVHTIPKCNCLGPIAWASIV